MEPGQLVSGKYRLLRLLGDGGMGTVYEAEHELLGTRVAIKVLHPELARRSGLVERFLQEARIAAQVRSPHVIQVLDVDRTPEGAAYIVMELLHGEALAAALDREHRVAVAIAIDYGIQILEGLETAHALGVIHRDLKPENVFVTDAAGGKKVLKLIDFGIAKLAAATSKNLTVAGVIMGTAEYMPPEQVHFAAMVDARSDIYALGVMLYEMIAGSRPVDGEDARAIASRVERGDVRPLVVATPDVPRELAGLIHRAMAARPELRFASASEMKLALLGIANKLGFVRSEVAHGTVLASPVEQAFVPARTPFANDRAIRTAPPAVVDMHGSGPSHLPSYPGRAAGPHKGKRSSIWLLVAIPILLGSGVVVALVVANSGDAAAPFSAASPPTAAASTRPSAPSVTASQTTASTPPTDATATVAPLVTTPSRPALSTAHAPTTRSSTPEGAPTILFPQIPPFPSVFPSGFPLPFPFPTATAPQSSAPAPAPSTAAPPVITIPTAFPSNFPFPLPPLSSVPTGAPTGSGAPR